MNWSYGVEKVAEFSTNTVVERVLAKVWPRRDEIAAFTLANDLSVCLCCNVTIHENRPVYDLSPDVMLKLATLNAEFSMDIFDYSE